MPLQLHPELVPIVSGLTGEAPPPPNNVGALRTYVDVSSMALLGRLPAAPSVETTDYEIRAPDGGAVRLRWYAKSGARSMAAVIYAHGGGMIAGSIDVYDPLVRHYVDISGVSFLAVGYRLAPEHRDVGLSRDVFQALAWLVERSAQLGIEASRIALMGDSGGGGVAAAAAIRARDAGIAVLRQILIYPMLDDRTIAPDPLIAPLALWTYEQNQTAWSAVCGPLTGDGDVPPTIAPARLAAFAGLPPAYIEVGELDIFRDESIGYAQRLLAAGVSCELIVQAGIPHGQEWLDFASGVSRRSFAERRRVLREL